MPEQKPAGDAQWTQQKADDRAAEREAVRQFEKFAKEQDPRTDFQKASDARHEAQSRSAAGKGLAVLPNTAGEPLALAAALTRAALDKCQPAWKAEPVAPARKVIPVADRKTVMPLEVSPDVRNQEAEAAEVCPMDIVNFNSTAQTVRFRPVTVNQLVPSNFQSDLSVANAVSYIYVHCETDGSQVNAATMDVSSTPRTPPAVTMGSAPSAFDVLVWVIVRTSSGGGYTFSKFKVWGCGNISATPAEYIRTDKSSPAPGQSSYDIWYAWQAVLG